LKNWIKYLLTIKWVQLWWVVGIVGSLWLGLATVVPEQWFKPIAVVLSAVQSAILFAARGTKYVESNTEPPQDGKP